MVAAFLTHRACFWRLYVIVTDAILQD